MYWHWHSIHNSVETYWKGLLSHDFAENDTYREACVIGKEFAEKGDHLVNLKKKNDVAILASNEALTALKYFPMESPVNRQGAMYNDVLRWMADALFDMNVECDIIWPETEDLDRYRVIITPALYAASDSLLERLRDYAARGGVLVSTFKTGFTDENVKVSREVQPRILRECMGVRYHQFAFPKNVKLTGEICGKKAEGEARAFMELLIPEGGEVLAAYDHHGWKDSAAVVRNQYGKGWGYYIGCMTDSGFLEQILTEVLNRAGVSRAAGECFPVIVKEGINGLGRRLRFYLNYSAEEQKAVYTGRQGRDILTGRKVTEKEVLAIPAWDLQIVEESEGI